MRHSSTSWVTLLKALDDPFPTPYLLVVILGIQQRQWDVLHWNSIKNMHQQVCSLFCSTYTSPVSSLRLNFPSSGTQCTAEGSVSFHSLQNFLQASGSRAPTPLSNRLGFWNTPNVFTDWKVVNFYAVWNGRQFATQKDIQIQGFCKYLDTQ